MTRPSAAELARMSDDEFATFIAALGVRTLSSIEGAGRPAQAGHGNSGSSPAALPGFQRPVSRPCFRPPPGSLVGSSKLSGCGCRATSGLPGGGRTRVQVRPPDITKAASEACHTPLAARPKSRGNDD